MKLARILGIILMIRLSFFIIGCGDSSNVTTIKEEGNPQKTGDVTQGEESSSSTDTSADADYDPRVGYFCISE